MKNQLKKISLAIVVTVTAMVSLNGTKNVVASAYGQSSVRLYTPMTMGCYRPDGSMWGTQVGCFDGTAPTCQTRSCPPDTPPPTNPPH